jgi:hypothetical protein
MVTQRVPREGLCREFLALGDGEGGGLPFTLVRIGDAEAPAIIAVVRSGG